MSLPDHIIGYGSLMSAYSRQTYSGLTYDVIPVSLIGWKRGWTTKSFEDRATYLGVRAVKNAQLSATLIPVEITQKLRDREKEYNFIEIDSSAIKTSDTLDILPKARFWIVVNRLQNQPTSDAPIPQSYVDTCMMGCLEAGGLDAARNFIQHTEFWDTHWVNDRTHPDLIYPRNTPITQADIIAIDGLLESEGILSFRTEP